MHRGGGAEAGGGGEVGDETAVEAEVEKERLARLF
jgi:hypothetical protein